MNILIIGINYAPEIVGIGPYTAGMANFLAARGHCVTVICAKPYYPQWEVDKSYAGGGENISVEHGVRVVRLPTYVPANPDGKRRLVHHLSFAMRAKYTMIREVRRSRPDAILGIAPSLISAIVAREAARRAKAKLWLHIQDFEVEAAFATGLLKDKGIFAETARRFEKWAIQADRVSTISPQMCLKLKEKGVPEERVVEFRNWANIDEIVPTDEPSPYRAEWQIERKYVAIYSGNIANKQGIELIVQASRLLQHRHDLIFIICGNGPNQPRLIEQSAGLDNIQFQDLQPPERLSDLLSLATIHLLPQIASAADLVLPSKLTNMLASGRAIVATADTGTGLAEEVQGCGLVTQPGNVTQFASAIEQLIDDAPLRMRLARTARQRAVDRWSKNVTLSRFEQILSQLVQ